MSLKYNGKLIPLAKSLRKNMTPQERKLWYGFLSKHQMRFQRQKVIDNYIVDFYCHKAKLIIELDGSQHFTDRGEAYDNIRTEVLEKYGLSVLRISNLDITKNFSGVCECINDSLSHLR